MSINFSANQYENAFKTLKNWEVPKGYSCYPSSRDGFTQIIATDRGHLMSGVPRSRSSPWGTFVGTWDMPTKIPGNCITNGTARSELAIDRLQRMKTEGDIIINGHLKKSKIPPALRMKGDIDATGVVKPPTPKSATGRLSGAGDPMAESRIRSGAQNPIPGSKFSPKSVDWPRPNESRLEKPPTPQRIASPPGGVVKPHTPIIFPLANGAYVQPSATVMPGSPEPELQDLQPAMSPMEPVNWPMPKSTEPQNA